MVDTGRSRQPGAREVLIVAAIAVAVVLGAAILTSVLPTNFQEVVFHTPLAIVVLLVGTGWLLWRIARDSSRHQRPMTEIAVEALPDAPATVPAPLVQRAESLAALERETWDVVIVGGGIVGAGALLDAVSRGMRAALVEQDDIASGTSSRSSRLIHGGFRYLEQLRIGLVREALAERARLLTLAPHLVRLEPLMFPVYGMPYLSKAFYDAGLTLYDILGARHDGGWHRRISKAEALELAPTLRAEGLHGALVYHDGVEDDARYTMAVVRTATAAGSIAVTRVRATGLQLDQADAAIRVLTAEDVMTGNTLAIRSRAIVDATGVWAAEAAHPFQSSSMRILPSRGAHLVVPRSRIPNSMGLAIRVPGKVVFLIPWPEYWLIGTTDAPFDGPASRPSAAAWEVDQLLETVNATMDVGLTRDDVVGTYAGLRPLIAPSDGSTVKASREHRVTKEDNGIIRVGGGKYTTYRVMARDVIDAVLGREQAKTSPERHVRAPPGRCRRCEGPRPDRGGTHDHPRHRRTG